MQKKRFGIYIKLLLLIVALLFVFFGISCNEKKEEKPQEKIKDPGIKTTLDRGPVSVTLEIDRKEVTIADIVNLKISVVADEDYGFELPGFGEKLEQFGIRDYHTSRPKLIENNKMKQTRTYILEPFLSGEYKIPSMKIGFWKKGEDEKNIHELETEELNIIVKSLLPDDMKDLKLHDIKPPESLPFQWSVWVWSLSVVLIIIAGVVFFYIILRRRSGQPENNEIQIPAHEIAFNALAELVSEDLVDKGEVKHFYQRISNILRYYIENRFSLHAPEQTTEEFLMNLNGSSSFPEKYHHLLTGYLNHCDLVKFAELQPEANEIQKTFDSCKAFITETMD